MVIQPSLQPIPIEELRPTQVVVGFREVREKRKRWTKMKDKAAFLGNHMIPAIIGPGRALYIVDHHHLARALLDEGVKDILISVIEDVRSLKKGEFWSYLDNRNWCHPYDQDGRRISFAHMPKGIAQLRDDPYRSLSGELRRRGAFAKDTTAFSEFLWADFLRRRIKKRQVAESFDKAITAAIKLARTKEAQHLPGWSGPKE